jgi:hypothetical protein
MSSTLSLYSILVPPNILNVFDYLSWIEQSRFAQVAKYFQYLFLEYQRVQNCGSSKFPSIFCLYCHDSVAQNEFSDMNKDMMSSFLYKELFLHYNVRTKKFSCLSEGHLPSLSLVASKCISSMNYFYLYYTNPLKKWGLYTYAPIPPNAFVSIYYGELITTQEMKERYTQNYDQQVYALS